MTKVIYIDPGGTRHEIEVHNGLSVMEGAVQKNIPGIDADCGGACACATCHVHVDPAWFQMLDPPQSVENDMLEFAVGVGDTSRLSCQITVRPSLAGLIVHLPETQR